MLLSVLLILSTFGVVVALCFLLCLLLSLFNVLASRLIEVLSDLYYVPLSQYGHVDQAFVFDVLHDQLLLSRNHCSIVSHYRIWGL